MNNELPRWRHTFFAVPLLFYVFTAARAPGWLDASLIAYYVGQLRLSSWVNHHNLFTVLGHILTRIFSNSDPHYVLVLVCAILGALTVHLMFLAGLEIARPLSAFLGALALMFSHSLWWHSTMVEVYTLNAAIIAGILFLLFRFERTSHLRCLYGAFLLWGLGCSNHILMGLFLPAFIAHAIMLRIQHRVEGWQPWVFMSLCFLAGISLFLGLLIHDTLAIYRTMARDAGAAHRILEAMSQTLDGATGGHFKAQMFTEGLTASRRGFWRLNYLFLVFVNYPSIALPLALFGGWVFWKRDSWKTTIVFFGLALVAQTIWSANYFIWDMYAFALPVYALLSIPVIYGMDWFVTRGRVTRLVVIGLAPTLLLPLFLYPAAENWYERGGFITEYFHQYKEVGWTNPMWEAPGYIANPNKRNYDLTKRIAEAIFRELPPNSTLMTSESRLDYPLRLYYQKTLGVRPDIRYLHFLGILLDEKTAESRAASLERVLAGSGPTYVTTVHEPDRQILNRLWLRQDPGADPDTIASLAEEQFVSGFPGLTFRRVDLVPDEGVYIYQVEENHWRER